MSDLVSSDSPILEILWIIPSLEEHSKALEDANKALELKKNDIRAILAKAESLFAGGHFEMGKSFDLKFQLANLALKT